MKLISVISVLTLLFSMSAYADFGNFTCKAAGLTIKLEVEEVSDVSLQTTWLTINHKKIALTQIKATQSDYGLLGINAQVGSGPTKYNYIFRNLGSAKCLGVYDSKQSGPALVEIVNSKGKIAEIICKCEQD